MQQLGYHHCANEVGRVSGVNTSHEVALTAGRRMDVPYELNLALSTLGHLLQDLSDGVDLRLKLKVSLMVAPVEVLPQGVKFVIATDYTVWIKHRYEHKDVVFEDACGCIVSIVREKFDHCFDRYRRRGLSPMDPSCEKEDWSVRHERPLLQMSLGEEATDVHVPL